MKDLEELRSSWQRTKIDSSRLDAENRRIADSMAAHKASVNRAQFNQFRLADFYWRGFIASIFIVLYSPVLLFMRMPAWMCVVCGIFGIVTGALNLSTYKFIYNIHLADMPVVTALVKSVEILRRQKNMFIAITTLAVMMVALLFWQVYVTYFTDYMASPLMFCSVLATLLILFFVILAAKLRRMRAYARGIKKELAGILHHKV